MRKTRDVVQVPRDVLLRLDARVVRLGALRLRHASLTRHADVLVIAHALLAQPADDLAFFAPKALGPFVQALHHLALHFRVGVMEVWVEKALEDLVSEAVHVHGVVVPRLDDSGYGVHLVGKR